MALGYASPFLIQRLRNPNPEGYPMDEIPRPDIPDITPPPSLQKPVTQQTPPMGESEKYFRAMQELRGNRPRKSTYEQILSESPDPSKYAPSGWRRLAAALAGGAMGATGQGVAGVKVAEQINRTPYEGAVEQWQSRLQPAQAAAQMEASDVEAQLKSLQDAYSHGLDYNKYLETVRHQRATEAETARQNQAQNVIATRNAATAEERADIARIVANNPDYEYIEIPGGVRAVDRKGKGQTYDIPGKTLQEVQADTAKFVAQTGRGMLGVAQQNAATNAQRANIYGADTESQIAYREASIDDMKADNERLTNDLNLREEMAHRLTPDDRLKAVEDTLGEMSADPYWGKWVDTDKDNNGVPVYSIKSGLTPAQYQIIKEELESRIGLTYGRGRAPVGGKSSRDISPVPSHSRDYSVGQP